MKSKIITALAIASTLSLPTAQADILNNISVYGQVNVSADRINDGAEAKLTNHKLVNNASRLGVTGSEVINDELSALFQAEGSVSTSDSSSTFTLNRNTYFGLRSAEFGYFIVGNYDTPYKISTRELDLFADSVAADNRSSEGINIIGGGHDTLRHRSINYMSNPMHDVSITMATTMGSDSAKSGMTKGTAFSLAGIYNNENIYATIAYDKVKVGSASTGSLAATTGVDALGLTAEGMEDKAVKLGGSYELGKFNLLGHDFNQFKFNAIAEQVTRTDATTLSNAVNTNLYLASKYNLSDNNSLKLAYARKGNSKIGGVETIDNVNKITIGFDRTMSKRTSAYALYSKTINKAAITDMGLATETGKDPSVWSLGMKHSF
jgi:predicted porin